MSVSCSLSESSSGCSCAGPAGFLSLRLRDETFPFAAQPLVYYAGVPEVYNERHKGLEKSDKSNCFVKAFRWYTQEHGPKKSIANETKEVGFASWLDHKYLQYLRDSQLNNASFISEAYIHPPTANQEPATHKAVKPKGFQRVIRSPWRKRRAAVKSSEGGHTCKECNSSWQVLLKPKSLSHLDSESCAKKRSITCRASSRVTVASSDTQMTVRTYSKRLGIVVQEITDYGIDNSIKKDIKKLDAVDSQNTYILDKNYTEVTNSKIKVKCECPLEINATRHNNRMDAGTQYDPNKDLEAKPLNNYPRDISKLDGCNKSTESIRSKERHIKINTGDKTKPKSSCAGEVQTPVPHHRCHYASKNIGNNRNQVFQNHQNCQKSVCCHVRANGSAQTSDYAITPGNVTCGRGLPLLVRIVSPRQ